MSLPPKEAIITFTDELVLNGQSTKETKRLLSHLSPTLGEAERGEGGCQSNHHRVYCNSGGLSSPEAQTHCLKWRKRQQRRKKEKKKTEPRDIAIKSVVQTRGLCKQRCEAVKRAKTASREFIWTEVKGQTAIHHGQS